MIDLLSFLSLSLLFLIFFWSTNTHLSLFNFGFFIFYNNLWFSIL
jgi:hypothetical protein